LFTSDFVADIYYFFNNKQFVT